MGPELLIKMEDQLERISQKLKEVADKQKSQANLKRTPRSFVVGDKVFLKVKPGKNSIKTFRLATRYVGPFEILQQVNPMAYKLQLPPNLSKIRNVFHVSLLKKYVPDPTNILNFEKLQMTDPLSFEVKPVCILGFRKKKLRNWEVDQCRVQWDQYSEQNSTWEDVKIMKQQFSALFNQPSM